MNSAWKKFMFVLAIVALVLKVALIVINYSKAKDRERREELFQLSKAMTKQRDEVKNEGFKIKALSREYTDKLLLQNSFLIGYMRACSYGNMASAVNYVKIKDNVSADNVREAVVKYNISFKTPDGSQDLSSFLNGVSNEHYSNYSLFSEDLEFKSPNSEQLTRFKTVYSQQEFENNLGIKLSSSFCNNLQLMVTYSTPEQKSTLGYLEQALTMAGISDAEKKSITTIKDPNNPGRTLVNIPSSVNAQMLLESLQKNMMSTQEYVYIYSNEKGLKSKYYYALFDRGGHSLQYAYESSNNAQPRITISI